MKNLHYPSSLYVRGLIILTSFLVLFLMLYFPVLSFDYVRHDDMQAFMWDHLSYKHQHTFYISMLQTIRPIAQLHITTWQFFLTQMSDGKFIRFFTICWFTVNAVLFFTVLRQLNYSRLFAFLTPFLIFSLPPFYVVAATIEYQHHLLAIFFVLLGFLMFLKNPNFIFIFFLLFGCSLLTYPPAGMIATTLVMAQLFAPINSNTPRNKTSLASLYPSFKILLAMAFAMIGYFVIGKLINHFFWHPIAKNSYEFTLQLNIFTILQRTWFTIHDSFNFWFLPVFQLHPNLLNVTTLLSYILIISGFISYFKRNQDPALLITSKLFLLMILILISPSSTTLSGIWHGSQRTLEGIMSLLLFLNLWSLYQIYLTLNARFKLDKNKIAIQASWVLSLLFIISTAVYSHWFLNKYFIQPQKVELTYIRNILSEILPKAKELNEPIRVHIILSKKNTLIQDNPIPGDEFGTLTSYYDYYWGLPLMIAMLREQGLDTPPPYVWETKLMKTSWGQFSISNPGEKVPYTLRQLHDVILINMNKMPQSI